jgi:hypothetical protein
MSKGILTVFEILIQADLINLASFMKSNEIQQHHFFLTKKNTKKEQKNSTKKTNF